MTNGIFRNTSINSSLLMFKDLSLPSEEMASEIRTMPFFCPTSSPNADEEDDFLHRDDEVDRVHSPTDNSEDSVEVKVSPISGRNKRKCAEPRRVQDPIFATGPLKKRMCLQARVESSLQKQQQQPFRPWSVKLEMSECGKNEHSDQPTNLVKNQNRCSPDVLEASKNEPLRLVKVESSDNETVIVPIKTEVPNEFSQNLVKDCNRLNIPPSQVFPYPSTIVEPRQNRPNIFPYFRPPSPIKITQDLTSPSSQQQPIALLKRQVDVSDPYSMIKPEMPKVPLRVPMHSVPSTSQHVDSETVSQSSSMDGFPKFQNHQRKEQRNYKNMTRERRIEANARERTRVHTISAAFDTLRKSVPSYSHSQKLSKLSVLRIACSYIMTLSAMVKDDSETVSDCVESVTRTIQREGKLRKKKDDSD